MQAGKGAGVVEGLFAHRALGQLVDWGKGKVQRNKEKDEKGVGEHVVGESTGKFMRDERE